MSAPADPHSHVGVTPVSNGGKCPNCKGYGDVMNWLTGAMERCSRCGGSGMREHLSSCERVKLAVTGARGSQRAGAPTRLSSSGPEESPLERASGCPPTASTSGSEPTHDEGSGMAVDSLKQIAEDAFLLAANIREGESLGETEDDIDAREAERQWRIVELIVSLGERVADTAGLDISDVWIPDAVRDLTDAGVK